MYRGIGRFQAPIRRFCRPSADKIWWSNAHTRNELAHGFVWSGMKPKPGNETITRHLSSKTTFESGDVAHEYLKQDFRRWLKREFGVLASILAIGSIGVYYFQYRENAPVNRVRRAIEMAKRSARQNNPQQALKHTLNAYSVAKNTNSRDRHLFEFAFTIAALYTTLQNLPQAVKYYQEALQSISYLRSEDEKHLARLVTLDRLAQCYEDTNQLRAAEKYFRQALTIVEKAKENKLQAPDVLQEAPGVLYNYGHFLLSQNRIENARLVLQKAKQIGKEQGIGQEEMDLIASKLSETNPKKEE